MGHEHVSQPPPLALKFSSPTNTRLIINDVINMMKLGCLNEFNLCYYQTDCGNPDWKSTMIAQCQVTMLATCGTNAI